jgi:hypothetical protein
MSTKLEVKATSGPWFEGTGWIGAGKLKDGNVVCRIPNYPYGNSEANARLIAAAPELLAFIELVARMRTEEEFGDDAPASEDWISTLNELITSARVVAAKAKGEA